MRGAGQPQSEEGSYIGITVLCLAALLLTVSAVGLTAASAAAVDTSVQSETELTVEVAAPENEASVKLAATVGELSEARSLEVRTSPSRLMEAAENRPLPAVTRFERF